MIIEVRKNGQVNIVEISGKMTIGQGDVQLREKLVELLNSGERFFVLDMTGVSYMDSAGLGEAVACAKRVRRHDGNLRIVALPGGKARELFHVTGLHRVIEIFSDEGSALSSFPG